MRGISGRDRFATILAIVDALRALVKQYLLVVKLKCSLLGRRAGAREKRVSRSLIIIAAVFRLIAAGILATVFQRFQRFYRGGR